MRNDFFSSCCHRIDIAEKEKNEKEQQEGF